MAFVHVLVTTRRGALAHSGPTPVTVPFSQARVPFPLCATRHLPGCVMAQSPVTHLSSTLAAEVDRRLMGTTIGYSLDQLMELAGHAVATAVVHFANKNPGLARDVCVVSGPGNCGGDGLVAARHLALMGFTVSVVAGRAASNFPSLTKQLLAFCIPFVDAVPSNASIVVDALFGFSFVPPLRGEVYPELIRQMNMSHVKLVSVDIPSGWDVDKGNVVPGSAVRAPDALVSLTAPKLCALELPSFCLHYVGGRFVPPALADELGFELPRYGNCGSEASPIVLLD